MFTDRVSTVANRPMHVSNALTAGTRLGDLEPTENCSGGDRAPR